MEIVGEWWKELSSACSLMSFVSKVYLGPGPEDPLEPEGERL